MPHVVVGDLAWQRRARPDQTHVADEHAPNLRQLVQAVLAQHAPNSRYARVDRELVELLVLGAHQRIVGEHFEQPLLAGPLVLLPYRRFNDPLDGAAFGSATAAMSLRPS